MALLPPAPSSGAPYVGLLATCPEPETATRQEIVQAMRGHGAYSITSTTTSTRFGAEALLAIVRARRRMSPRDTQLLIRQSDWFAAHLEVAGVDSLAMSAGARAALEHNQDALVDFGPGVVQGVVEGPAPRTALDVTLFWPDSGDSPDGFSYRDTLSVPRLEVHDARIVRFKLLEYDDMLVFDRITGISVKPFGFLSAVFAVLGRPDLRQTRIAVATDEWQVVRGQVKVFAGLSKTGTATIDPEGRGHEGVPTGREDLKALARRLGARLDLRYGPPSCQAQLRIRAADACRWVMGSQGTCIGQ